MLIASRNDGVIDASEAGRTYLKRVAYLNKPPNFKPLIECGFLESASALLADASALLADARPETETETYKEEKRESGALRRRSLPEGFGISPRVQEWAVSKGYGDYLEAHFEKFMSYIKVKQPRYVDWDEALMGCIRDDWGDIRKRAGVKVVHSSERPSIVCQDCGKRAHTWTGHRCDPCWKTYMNPKREAHVRNAA